MAGPSGGCGPGGPVCGPDRRLPWLVGQANRLRAAILMTPVWAAVRAGTEARPDGAGQGL